MLDKFRPRSAYDVVALLALFIAVGTGGAYAANTIGSADIIDESIVSADLKNYGVKRSDIGLDSINSARIEGGTLSNSDFGLNAVTGNKVLDNTLTGADIDESALQVTQGSGTRVLANRIVPGNNTATQTLLTIPNLGTLVATCYVNYALIEWRNTTSGPIDAWTPAWGGIAENTTTIDGSRGRVVAPWTPGYQGETVALDDKSTDAGDASTFTLGVGWAAGTRTTATVHASAHQAADGHPCGFQAQATVWTG